MPEELALDQRFGKGAAIDHHQGATGAIAPAVEVAGQHLLAAAGLAGQTDRRGRGGDLAQRLEGLAHGRAVGDGLFAAEASAQGLVFRGQGSMLLGLEIPLLGADQGSAGFGGENGEEGKLGCAEAVGGLEAVDVKHPADTLALGQGHAHHAVPATLTEARGQLAADVDRAGVGDHHRSAVAGGADRQRPGEDLIEIEIAALEVACQNNFERTARVGEEQCAALAAADPDAAIDNRSQKVLETLGRSEIAECGDQLAE